MVTCICVKRDPGVVKIEAPPTSSDELTASEVAHSLEWRKEAAGSNPRMSSDSSLNLAVPEPRRQFE